MLHGRDHKHRYQILSNVIKLRATNYLGHIIREPEEWEHVRRITLTKAMGRVEKKYKKGWETQILLGNETISFAYRIRRERKKWRPKTFSIENKKQRRALYKAAKNREFPFNKKQIPKKRMGIIKKQRFHREGYTAEHNNRFNGNARENNNRGER